MAQASDFPLQLLRIMSDINESLNVDEVLQKVMDQLIELTRAERGVIALIDKDSDDIRFPVARDMDRATLHDPGFEVSRTLIRNVASSGKPQILFSAREDPQYAKNASVTAKGLVSVLCVPLITRNNDVLGAVWVDNTSEPGIFKKKDLELFTEFARHAANAIDHADKYSRLNELRLYQESIFESVINGILVVDTAGRITAFNRAAETIFGLTRDRVLHHPLTEVLEGRAAEVFGELLRAAAEGFFVRQAQYSGYFLGVGRVELVYSVAPLRTDAGDHIGATLVLEDVWEKRSMEKDRDSQAAEKEQLQETLGKLLPVDVMSRVGATDVLEGSRFVNVAVMYLLLDGFVKLCEDAPFESPSPLINEFLGELQQIVDRNRGSLIKLLADEVMVVFNDSTGHADCNALALWTAVEFSRRARELQATRRDHPGLYRASIALHCGAVASGPVGTEKRLEFTAVGDTVNLAAHVARLNRQFATRILVTDDFHRQVQTLMKREVELVPRGQHRPGGRQNPVTIYELREL